MAKVSPDINSHVLGSPSYCHVSFICSQCPRMRSTTCPKNEGHGSSRLEELRYSKTHARRVFNIELAYHTSPEFNWAEMCCQPTEPTPRRPTLLDRYFVLKHQRLMLGETLRTARWHTNKVA